MSTKVERAPEVGCWTTCTVPLLFGTRLFGIVITVLPAFSSILISTVELAVALVVVGDGGGGGGCVAAGWVITEAVVVLRWVVGLGVVVVCLVVTGAFVLLMTGGRGEPVLLLWVLKSARGQSPHMCGHSLGTLVNCVQWLGCQNTPQCLESTALWQSTGNKIKWC